jgi:adenylosuccinate synthase
MSDFLRAKAGDEVGRTTGRPRRCGWFDAVMVKRAVELNGANGLAITKLDILDGMKEVKIAVGYKLNGKPVKDYPSDSGQLAKCKPVYRIMPGWSKPTSGLRSFEKLPENAKRYIRTIEQLTGAKAVIVSVGSERRSTIMRSTI